MKKDINTLKREKKAETGIERKRKVKNSGDEYGIKKKGIVPVTEDPKHSFLSYQGKGVWRQNNTI